MNEIKGNIDQYGFPTIREVIVENPIKHTSINLTALVDTGSEELFLKPHLIERLQLNRTSGIYAIHPIHGKQEVYIYSANLKIQGFDFGSREVMQMLNAFPYDFIIGCGLFKEWNMNYRGKEKEVSLQFE